MLTACSGTTANNTAGPSPATSTVSPPAEMPSSTFIADMAGRAGETTTMAVAVEQNRVVAYVTNGTDDEAGFVGTQKGETMTLMSEYGDTLTASFDGTALTGELRMNDADAAQVKFSAAAVSAPAGLYSASRGDARATWVVRPDRSMVGMMNLDTRGHQTVADARRMNDKAYMEQLSLQRRARQLQPAPPMDSMSATRVSGDDISF